MTGLGRPRVYLDWNASAPLRPEAREAMLRALDAAGNPSSVHAEGRAARAILNRARAQVAAFAGAAPEEVVFTSGASEGAALLGRLPGGAEVHPLSHDCLLAWHVPGGAARAAGVAEGETGALLPAPEAGGRFLLLDPVQSAGRLGFDFRASGADAAILSAHKIGGPKGTGALLLRGGAPVLPGIRGGGQERGHRAGTENLPGIAGFGAAAEAAARDLGAGLWTGVAALRDRLEDRLSAIAPDLVIPGRSGPRLPNTTCLAVPGWQAEAQVMALDLAGFAVSAGAACSSGKVRRASRVLLAMGFGEAVATSAVRVSLGPVTTEAEVMAFAEAWTTLYRRRAAAPAASLERV